jgi:hypothetical protein
MNPKLPAIQVSKSRRELTSKSSMLRQKSKGESNETIEDNESTHRLVVNFSLTPDEKIQEGVKNMIHEYLVKMSMMKTLDAFKEEVLTRVGRASFDYQEALLYHFDQGDKGKFFDTWKKYAPVSMRIHDKETIKLEFYINLYFITAKLNGMGRTKKATHNHNFRIDKKPREKVDRAESFTEVDSDAGATIVKQAMSELKTFLTINGEELAKIEELLPYYALPYLKDPYTHPLFKNIFTDEWRIGLVAQLKDFLEKLYPAQSKPCLLQIYEKSLKNFDSTESQNPSHMSRLGTCQFSREIKENISRVRQSLAEIDSQQRSLKISKSLRKFSESGGLMKTTGENSLAHGESCEIGDLSFRGETHYASPNKILHANMNMKVKQYVDKLETDNKNLVGLVEILNQKVKDLESEQTKIPKSRPEPDMLIENIWESRYKELIGLTGKLFEFASIFRNGREQFLDILEQKFLGFQGLVTHNEMALTVENNDPNVHTETQNSATGIILSFITGEIIRKLSTSRF